MNTTFAPIAEWRDVDADTFHNQIRKSQKPAIMRGLASSWPAVERARRSDRAVCDYLVSCDIGKPFGVLFAPPEVKGKFFYGEDLNKVNFARTQQPLGVALNEVLRHENEAEPPAIFIQSAPVGEHMPQFARDNPMPFLPSHVMPRIWIGNAVTVRNHCDANENIACLAAGKRRFTLFPPSQLHNLYIGPLDNTPSGSPVSMVNPEAPDLERYPRFAEAMQHAVQGELLPGDAIYIPYMWWHHVQSLTPFNILVNYWWNDVDPALISPFSALFLGIAGIRGLPEDQRKAWREMFDYYVFQLYDDPAAHLDPAHQGVIGPLTPENIMRVRASVAHTLMPPKTQ